MKVGFGEFIQKHRIKSGYKSQRELARVSGISSATISRIENEIQKPEIDTLHVLSKYLKTTNINELMNACNYKLDIENNTIELTDSAIVQKLNITIDGQKINERELEGIIAFTRAFRKIGKNK